MRARSIGPGWRGVTLRSGQGYTEVTRQGNDMMGKFRKCNRVTDVTPLSRVMRARGYIYNNYACALRETIGYTVTRLQRDNNRDISRVYSVTSNVTANLGAVTFSPLSAGTVKNWGEING
jgi:hypothetical protein